MMMQLLQSATPSLPLTAELLKRQNQSKTLEPIESSFTNSTLNQQRNLVLENSIKNNILIQNLALAEAKRNSKQSPNPPSQSKSKTFQRVKKVEVTNTYRSRTLDQLTVDEKLDTILNGRRGKKIESLLVREDSEQDNGPKKIVKKQIEVSEEDVIGINALREIMLRERTKQLQLDELYHSNIHEKLLDVKHTEEDVELDEITQSGREGSWTTQNEEEMPLVKSTGNVEESGQHKAMGSSIKLEE